VLHVEHAEDAEPPRYIPVHELRTNPDQPRTTFDEADMADLVTSIRQDGIIQPLTVRSTPTGYELIAGERRLRAALEAGLDTVPVHVRETSDMDLLRLALVENLQRAALNPLEEATAYRRLVEETGLTQAEIADRVGKSRQWVNHHLGLLRLPPSVQLKVAAGVISLGHAKALLSITSPSDIEHLAERIVAEGLTVRNVEEIVTLGDETVRRRVTGPRRRTQDIPTVTDTLSRWLDTRVRVQLGKHKGRIVVEFSSMEDLDRMLAVMSEPAPTLRAASQDR
jgi:ParB family transcriptional regulator, chromosome partitioning protein